MLLRSSMICAALVLAASAPALADAPAKTDIPARARALAERGRAHHDAGDYTGAIAAFTEAYALAPSPALLFNLAQSYRLAGQCENASTMYNRFLATDPPPEARALAETNVIAMDQCVAALRPVNIPAPPVAAVVDAPPPSDRWQRAATERDVGVGLGIGGGIALIGALAFEIRAHNASETVSQTYEHGGMGSTIASLDASGRHDAALSDAFGVVGVTAVGAGIAMYWLGSHEAAARHVAVVPTARGAEVHAAWSF